MLRWSTSCCPTGERRPLTLPFVSWLHKGRSVSSLLLLLFSSLFLSIFHCSHVGISGHLTWGRLQQPQEQRCPFLPVCAVSFKSPYLRKAAAATRAVLPIPTNVCCVIQVASPGEGCSSHKSSAAHSYQCVQCLGIQGIVWLPVFGVTDVHTDVEGWNRGCTDTLKRVCIKHWLAEKKSLAAQGSWTCGSMAPGLR